MNPNLQLNSSGSGRAHDNDFSTNKNAHTTNHIYLHPGSNQGEFDDWMKRIGALLQVGAGYASIKPVLELIIAVFEPERLFVVNHQALPELGVEEMLEILVVLDESQSSSKRIAKNRLKMACFKQNNVVIHFDTSGKVERGIQNGYPYYCMSCIEDNLVFSNSPYRLQKPSDEELAQLKLELPQRLDSILKQVSVFLSEADQLAEKQLSNLAALMLHQGLKYLYNNLLFEYNRKVYTDHGLSKLHLKVEKFMPQVCSQIRDYSIGVLDDVSKYATAPFYDVGEIWDVQAALEEVNKVVDLTKTIFEKRIVSLS